MVHIKSSYEIVDTIQLTNLILLVDAYNITLILVLFFRIGDWGHDRVAFSSPEFDGLRYNKYLHLGYYVFDVNSFYPYINELTKRFFVIKKKYMETAKIRFENLNINTNDTKVSIHIRLTDYHGHLKVMFNMTHEYFFNGFIERAMTYFVKKYGVSIRKNYYIKLR